MKRFVAILAVLALGFGLISGGDAFADEFYLGARGIAPITLTPFALGTIGFGAHLGVNLGEPGLGFGVRGLAETDVAFSAFRAGADLYARLGDLSSFYVGAGGSLAVSSELQPEVHGLVGLETRLGGLGLFLEAMPGYAFSVGGFGLRVAAGLNLHF